MKRKAALRGDTPAQPSRLSEESRPAGPTFFYLAWGFSTPGGGAGDCQLSTDRLQILEEVFLRVVQIGSRLPQEGFGLPPARKAEHPLNFLGGENSGAIGRCREGFQRL